MVKHIVLMKAKPGRTDDEAAAIMAELAGLVGRIEGLIDFSGGKDITGGARTDGYTHGFVMTFADAGAVEAYQPHPEHRKIAAKVRDFSDAVLAFDYEYR